MDAGAQKEALAGTGPTRVGTGEPGPVPRFPGGAVPSVPVVSASQAKRNAIRRVLRGVGKEIARCAGFFLCQNQVIAHFTVDEAGVVHDLEIQRGWGADPPAALLPCVRAALDRTRFLGIVRPGQPLQIQYPLHYSCALPD